VHVNSEILSVAKSIADVTLTTVIYCVTVCLFYGQELFLYSRLIRVITLSACIDFESPADLGVLKLHVLIIE